MRFNRKKKKEERNKEENSHVVWSKWEVYKIWNDLLENVFMLYQFAFYIFINFFLVIMSIYNRFVIINYVIK
jgi:hypothetical protein